MKIPYEPILFGIQLNIHLILEYLAFFLAYRYYIYLRKNTTDSIKSSNRLSIILGAAIGAFIGSRLVGFFENPHIDNYNLKLLISIFNNKTIMGGLFGGLIGVELAKKLIGEKKSSGDLFTYPIMLGIFIGRIGCFLSGVNEFTYGTKTTLSTGMDLGDGVLRHPIALYELVFLTLLALFLKKIQKNKTLQNGELFKYFMISYFSFRFLIEFIKPNTFFVLGLSSIQLLCVLCIIFYSKTIYNLIKQ